MGKGGRRLLLSWIISWIQHNHAAFLLSRPSSVFSLESSCVASEGQKCDTKHNSSTRLQSTTSPTKPATSTTTTTTEIFNSILSSSYQSLDPALPDTITELKSRKAHLCWHKHSTFLDHLLGVHHTLRLWGQSPLMGRVGLLHSAFSNSYVNTALFDRTLERHVMQGLIGKEAEELVYLYCVIDRQDVVVNTLLKHGVIPAQGLTVPHLLHKNETVSLSPDFLQKLLIFTMADIADQYFGWQDVLFSEAMLVPGKDDVTKHNPMALWPGVSQPGLWMNYVSQLGKVARTYEGDETVLPPVFEGCTVVVGVEEERRARDLYWEVVTTQSQNPTTTTNQETTIQTLQECIHLNPNIFEPHVTLAQLYLHQNNPTQAQFHAAQALKLQEMWGTSWDKRLSFGAWVAWTKVLYQRAEEGLGWPMDSWEVNNFGLVR